MSDQASRTHLPVVGVAFGELKKSLFINMPATGKQRCVNVINVEDLTSESIVGA